MLAADRETRQVSYDYPGYGRSEPGMCSEEGMCASMEAVYDVSVNRMGVPPQQVLIWGKSLGTGPSVFIASQLRPVSGVVLVSPLASGARCVIGGLPRALMGAADSVCSQRCSVLVACARTRCAPNAALLLSLTSA